MKMKSPFLALVFVLFFNAGSLAFLQLWRPKIRHDCLLPKAEGICYGHFPRYYFDLVSRRCRMFIYGGCLGNKNNFKTMQDCEANCTCFLPKITGDCRAYFPRYFFNYTTKTCERFIYGGCQGNSNNFKTIAECYKTCPYQQIVVNWNSVCHLPKVVGPCRAKLPRYFYNTDTQKCEFFEYGGCRGNQNNFRTLSGCKQFCENP